MRRHALLVVLVLMISACSGETGGESATSAAPAATTAAPTTAAPTTTTTTSTTTTTTTTTAAPTTTTTSAPLDFVTLERTPPDSFESFTAEVAMTMSMGEIDLEINGEGIWTEDAFSCTVATGLNGLTITQSLVATPETLWVDDGAGYNESHLFDDAAQQVMAICPTSPLFWADFASDDFDGFDGEETDVGGRAATKTELGEALQSLGALGVIGDLDGADINELTMWFDDETRVILALVADMEMPAELMGEPADSDPVRIVMEITLGNVNDADLSVELP